MHSVLKHVPLTSKEKREQHYFWVRVFWLWNKSDIIFRSDEAVKKNNYYFPICIKSVYDTKIFHCFWSFNMWILIVLKFKHVSSEEIFRFSPSINCIFPCGNIRETGNELKGPSQADDVTRRQLICLPFADAFDLSHFFGFSWFVLWPKTFHWLRIKWLKTLNWL